jgi:hypothetical protein
MMLLINIEMKHKGIYSQCIIGGYNIRSFLFFLLSIHKKFSRTLINFICYFVIVAIEIQHITYPVISHINMLWPLMKTWILVQVDCTDYHNAWHTSVVTLDHARTTSSMTFLCKLLLSRWTLSLWYRQSNTFLLLRLPRYNSP